MRPKSLLLLALALGCGLVASIGISQVMENNKQGPTGVATEKIYVAQVNINTGDPISADMVMLKEWPKGDIPQGALGDISQVEDRRPRTPIFKGEAILESKLLNPGEKGADPTAQIPKGYRIVPISVRADTGAAGLLRPGDRVDVQWYVARNPQLGIRETVSKTILHNVRVFAIDQSVVRAPGADEQPTLAKTISLLLSPADANKVQLATKIGEVSLIPRNPDDPSANNMSRVTFKDLFEEKEAGKGSRFKEQGRDETANGSEQSGFLATIARNMRAGMAAATAMQQAQPPWEMEVVRGGEVALERFDASTGKPLRQMTSVSAPYGGSMIGFGQPIGPRDSDVGEFPITNPSPTAEDTNGERSTVPPKADSDDGAPDFPIDL